LRPRRVGNSPPVADAGPDQIGIAAGTVTLNGTGSYDPEGDPLTYQWTQISGPNVPISNSATATATFPAAAGQSYSFRLTVKDSGGLQSTARTTVTTITVPDLVVGSFSATPTGIVTGESATLSWTTQNATRVDISGVGTSLPTSGSRVVSPTQTTTYTLTATGPDGTTSVAAPVTVTVTTGQASRILQFSLNP